MDSQWAIVLIVVWVALVGAVAWLADSWGRSAFWWVAVAFVFSPIAALSILVFLLAIGGGEARKGPLPDDPLGPAVCATCGAGVNWATHEGVHSPEDRPWVFLCDACGSEVRVETS